MERRVCWSTLEPAAVRAGDVARSIPTCERVVTQPPVGYTEGGRYVAPHEDDKPLFAIKGQNDPQYTDKLSAGQVAMAQEHPLPRLVSFRYSPDGKGSSVSWEGQVRIRKHGVFLAMWMPQPDRPESVLFGTVQVKPDADLFSPEGLRKFGIR